MLEIVFNDSACGSLKMAQGFNSEDVLGFNLMLSVGNISSEGFIAKRAKAIEELWSIYPEFPEDEPFNLLENIQNGLESVRKRITADDEVRIWYSNNPDELCGLYWFMAELATLKTQPKAVYTVKLPEYKQREDDALEFSLSWGEIEPSTWCGYTTHTEKATEIFCKYCVSTWETLQKENMALRAIINGQIHSVDENIYDTFIIREIAEQADEFSEAMLIGKILGKHRLGLSDSWLAKRIEHFIANGSLKAISTPAQDAPIYHRQLKKVKPF